LTSDLVAGTEPADIRVDDRTCTVEAWVKVGYPRSRRIILEDSIEASSFADNQLDPCYLFFRGIPAGHDAAAPATGLAWTA
jgi:hypothetical protein